MGLFRPTRRGLSLALTTNTMLTIALSHLLGRGVRLETHEAVALARELMAEPCGSPTPESIQLGSDGSASCTSTAGVPSVASVAGLLLTLLPDGTPNVPAPLRYAIARGLGAVEAPPFASLGEFSSALERFEKGASRDVLRGVLQRGARPPRPIEAPIAAVPTPVTPPAAPPSPVASRPTVVAPRPTLVVRTPAATSNQPPPPIAAAPPIFTGFGADGEAGSLVHWSRRWSLAAAAAVVASFTVGFVVADEITDRRAATERPGSARVSAGVAAASPAANDSEANAAVAATRDGFVRVLQTIAVAREILPLPAVARAGARADAASPVGEQLRAMQAVRAIHANAFSPAFAPDGAAIFFHTGRERDARSAIELAQAGSQAAEEPGVETIVDDGSHNYHAKPSPDGRLVAFDSDRDGARGVYVANRDGSPCSRVSGAGYAAVPTWSLRTSGSPTSGPKRTSPLCGICGCSPPPAAVRAASRTIDMARRGRPRGSLTTAASPTATRTR